MYPCSNVCRMICELCTSCKIVVAVVITSDGIDEREGAREMASEHDYGCPPFGCFVVPYSMYMLCTILNSTQNQSYVSRKTLLCAQDNVGCQFRRPMSLLPIILDWMHWILILPLVCYMTFCYKQVLERLNMCVLSGATVTQMSSISLFSTQHLHVFCNCSFSGSFSSLPNTTFPMAASLDV